VPELCRFFGIIIRMYREAGARHHTPHFHAYYQEDGRFSASSLLKWHAGRYRHGSAASSKPGPNFTNKSF
jgi:hypothetical protein